MPKIRLTQPAVDRLKPPANGRVEYWDSQLPGFGLRISESGRKSWCALYRVAGRSVRETIGTLALIPSVAEARARARASMQAARDGVHPVEARRGTARAAEIAEEKAAAETFAVVADRYLTAYVQRHCRPSTAKEQRRILERDVKLRWGARPIASITRQDVAGLLDEIADRGAPVQANRTLAHLRTLFRWAADSDLIVADPTARVRRRIKEVARDRVLSDAEIRWFWAACEEAAWPFGRLFQLLLLTAQRRDEVGGMEWGELDLEKEVWTLPREKAKNDRTHEVHLSPLAREVIEALPRLGARSRFVFSTTGSTAVSGFSRAKTMLDRRMAELAGEPIADWRLHDLRRTAATGMARLGIAPHVADRVLGHTAGTIRGVAAVYNRFQYLDEATTAIDAWGRYIESLVRPLPLANVVPLRSAAG